MTTKAKANRITKVLRTIPIGTTQYVNGSLVTRWDYNAFQCSRLSEGHVPIDSVAWILANKT